MRVGDDHTMGEVARLDAGAAQLDEVLQRLGEQLRRRALGLGPALVMAQQLDDDGVAQRPFERRGRAVRRGPIGAWPNASAARSAAAGTARSASGNDATRAPAFSLNPTVIVVIQPGWTSAEASATTTSSDGITSTAGRLLRHGDTRAGPGVVPSSSATKVWIACRPGRSRCFPVNTTTHRPVRTVKSRRTSPDLRTRVVFAAAFGHRVPSVQRHAHGSREAGRPASASSRDIHTFRRPRRDRRGSSRCGRGDARRPFAVRRSSCSTRHRTVATRCAATG